MSLEPEEFVGIVIRPNPYYKIGAWIEFYLDQGLPVAQEVTVDTINNRATIVERNGMVFPKHLVREYVLAIQKEGIDA